MIYSSLYDIFLNPSICFDVVNNSDFVIVASQIKSFFPIFNFFNFIFLSDFFVLENFPILFPKSIPNKIIFFAPKWLAKKTPLSPSVNPPKFWILLNGLDWVVPIQFLIFFTISNFSILSPCACMINIDFVFAIFLIVFSSPSKSVTTISGIIPLSTNGFNELSAAILIYFFNFFSFGIAIYSEGPEPITKTVLPSINFKIFLLISTFFRIESKIIADSLSFFSL